ARAPRLRWVQVHMAGVNALYEHPLYRDTAIALTTTSGVHAATIAEYAITMLLALAHRVPRMVEWQGRGAWPPDEDRWSLFVPTEIRGAVLGIVGYGSIGRELARIAKTAFGMSILACKRRPSERADAGYTLPGTGDPEGRLPDAWFAPEQLAELLARSDAVVMCAPLTPKTTGMIGAAALRAMKPSAYFINVGRGPPGIEMRPPRPPARNASPAPPTTSLKTSRPPPGILSTRLTTSSSPPTCRAFSRATTTSAPRS